MLKTCYTTNKALASSWMPHHLPKRIEERKNGFVVVLVFSYRISLVYQKKKKWRKKCKWLLVMYSEYTTPFASSALGNKERKDREAHSRLKHFHCIANWQSFAFVEWRSCSPSPFPSSSLYLFHKFLFFSFPFHFFFLYFFLDCCLLLFYCSSLVHKEFTVQGNV